jgi:cation diffusion facilitator family transporter
MFVPGDPSASVRHRHVFLGAGHEGGERRTWAVIWLCGTMMAIEIVGGLAFGSIALVADGLHMSTHAGALLLAALAYTYARRHADDSRFTFGTGKVGDLAGYTSAIILAMIALLIAFESIERFLSPAPIRFAEALPIACLGLAVNIVSAWLLGGGADHSHGHAHRHSHDAPHAHGHDDAFHRVDANGRIVRLEIFEDGVPPRFRVRAESGTALSPAQVGLETLRHDGTRQIFRLAARGDWLESEEEVPEPHAFAADLSIDGQVYSVLFEEQEHGAAVSRDNNMRAAIVHVLADAAVSVLVIAGLALAWAFGWTFTDPLAGLVGALVIASWSVGLVRDTGAILLDMTADKTMARNLRALVEGEGDELADLHLWRLGPGHLGAILTIVTREARDAAYYREKLAKFRAFSHLTVELVRLA